MVGQIFEFQERFADILKSLENKGELVKSDFWNEMLTSKPELIGKAFNEAMLLAVSANTDSIYLAKGIPKLNP